MHFAKEHRYKHFLITIYETENGLFRALISRATRNKLKRSMEDHMLTSQPTFTMLRNKRPKRLAA
jgi:hypothetical protein